MALSQRTQAKISQMRSEVESINTALSAIEGGAQSYTIGDVTYTRGNMGNLYGRKDRLEKDIDRLLGARPVALGVSFGGMQR